MWYKRFGALTQKYGTEYAIFGFLGRVPHLPISKALVLDKCTNCLNIRKFLCNKEEIFLDIISNQTLKLVHGNDLGIVVKTEFYHNFRTTKTFRTAKFQGAMVKW